MARRPRSIETVVEEEAPSVSTPVQDGRRDPVSDREPKAAGVGERNDPEPEGSVKAPGSGIYQDEFAERMRPARPTPSAEVVEIPAVEIKSDDSDEMIAAGVEEKD